MPLDDLSLDLKPASAPRPELEVMTRVLRLPTRSLRQARAITRLQLDRLSPLPVADTVFELAPLGHEAGETVYALGVLRRSALADPAFGAQRIVAVAKTVGGQDVVFRFRNAGAVDDREARWLRHAPRAAMVCLGLAAVALAGQLRAEQWRERRLPEIAAEQRLAARAARLVAQQAAARADWAALGRTDAATRYLCAATRIAAVRPDGVAVTGAAADGQRVSLTLAPGTDAASLVAALELPPAAGAQTLAVTFPSEVCG
ncbi:hypothetical protein [Brevundimonas sp.]|uniref:hypothetical protein n=1 Tax=Brevundimonas sp. TaxID=1871086 RepID=UPI002D5CA5E7|nr:hypothetical protein [Brevundimonas sp.]HYC74687.1 hypothetical protein [Brevundimonas sp.]